jgi:hypothetical protein
VFDDITALLQAQREAAWGEVATPRARNQGTRSRRSSCPERLRRACSPACEARRGYPRARHAHHRAQVETMQKMVNAFSGVRRAPEMLDHALQSQPAGGGSGGPDRSQDPRTQIILDLDSPHRDDRGRSRPGAPVLNNLVTNALEASGVVPTLEITTKLEVTGGCRVRRGERV